MKLHFTHAGGRNLITGYGDGWVDINNQRHTSHLIVLPHQLIQSWDVTDLESIKPKHFEKIATYQPDIVLLGSGKRHQFIHPKLSIALTNAGISIECMTTNAACRTYNILMAEGRNVAACLLIA
jgi:uncharacterized protein